METYLIHKLCEGCDHIVDGKCTVYLNPSYWWEVSSGKQCPKATHLSKAIDTKKIDKKLPPLVPKSKDRSKDGVRTPKRFSFRTGRHG